MNMPPKLILVPGGRQAAMDSTGQHQHAGEFAARVRQLYLSVERPARTFERETFRFGFSIAGFDFGRPRDRVDAPVAQAFSAAIHSEQSRPHAPAAPRAT
jgi:hypothetical protein